MTILFEVLQTTPYIYLFSTEKHNLVVKINVGQTVTIPTVLEFPRGLVTDNLLLEN